MTRIILTVAALFTLTACATIEGAGKDLESAGQAISSEAREAQAGN
ncbi:entericidin A/B family lipoprotein [Actibacterium sp. D379-3]